MQLTQKKYIISPFLQHVKNNKSAIIWHSLFGYPKIVSIETLEFIQSFSQPEIIESKIEKINVESNEKIIKELKDCYFIIPIDLNEREILKRKNAEYTTAIYNGSLIKYLSLIISETCNFNCSYCIHNNNLKDTERLNTTKTTMSFEVAKKAIDEYISILQKNQNDFAEINFGGGEPLLEWKTIKKILEYCKTNYSNEFSFSINTNIYLINNEIRNF